MSELVYYIGLQIVHLTQYTEEYNVSYLIFQNVFTCSCPRFVGACTCRSIKCQNSQSLETTGMMRSPVYNNNGSLKSFRLKRRVRVHMYMHILCV